MQVDPVQQVVRGEIPDRRDYRVARPVMLLIVAEQVVPRHRAKVRFAADHAMTVGMHLESGGFDGLHQPKHGRRLVALALGDDDRAL